ncbi:MAG: Rrf2 family transcriptional regulator [Planctomycetes bacterium]|nr:Rrf2 family transcriptional regulator [Planctomycetota bacterium]MCB9824746.1 Rrf2 family transcriptional regulator [Planctomycetota bacterium]MCB9830438.1 Rrf2 family transcriptional regulator [Planctomycetota bacterium]MCB9899843.1 Rrf2 family transcriptional regulator [Planctomycetota bacterium]
MHGKATETAIAAMGYLAERYDGGTTLVSAADIARHRKLQRPYVAKVLTELARAGLVRGVRGPGGGYALARDPGAIHLIDVHALFERADDDACPFGGGICGQGEKCPLHDAFAKVRAASEHILQRTTLAVFRSPRRSST